MIIPRPTRLARTPGWFTFDEHTAVRAEGSASAAARLLRTLLAPATGLPLRPAPAGEVVLAVDPCGDGPGPGGLGAEGYELTVRPDGLLLRAARPAGLLRGVQTIRQLLPPEALSARPAAGVPWRVPCVRITDVPRFGWRGVLLDVARRFQPVSFLRRFVDLLALHKLNVLHLHLTDDQGWRMPVAAYPRLTEVGGVRARSMLGRAGSGRFDDEPHAGAYTAAELRSLVAYAAERGVTVVPEIEMPGHARAALAAYPELGNVPGRRLEVWTEWGVSENVLGVHDEVLDFCRTVLGEVLDVFPSRYVHVGGDECPVTEWESSARARSRAAGLGIAPKELHGWFLGRIGRFLLDAGRTPLCWAEDSGALPPEFAVMPWRDTEHGLSAARRGHQVVMAPYRSTYLDYPQSDAPGEPLGQAGAVVDLRTVHGGEPAPASWEPAAAAQVLGTQAQLWSEFVRTPADIEYLAFPRLCALADRAWNPASDWAADFLPALARHEARLVALGVGHRAAGLPGPGPLPPSQLSLKSP
ncbi:beta-N-acetylhexosaminidase [Actinacidiphila sp. ITFR-21]|uniref:beta-N-acetylhexosaminidase n=1 Tax=Actinacidiphila sp. ITFR-21 TaxID=3075199 RepID=UPI00288B856F|nr:beta-N-acetylhexosaminidase [Streptomyces sp. ITFR-21]WNI18545.1 beta-N-acetylhexosaminidase [Streptomyces sp. ITFR-21]